jgi:hypothetical protein
MIFKRALATKIFSGEVGGGLDFFGGVLIWWGEATDGPAREDARPTRKWKLGYHHFFLRAVASFRAK